MLSSRRLRGRKPFWSSVRCPLASAHADTQPFTTLANTLYRTLVTVSGLWSFSRLGLPPFLSSRHSSPQPVLWDAVAVDDAREDYGEVLPSYCAQVFDESRRDAIEPLCRVCSESGNDTVEGPASHLPLMVRLATVPAGLNDRPPSSRALR